MQEAKTNQMALGRLSGVAMMLSRCLPSFNAAEKVTPNPMS